ERGGWSNTSCLIYWKRFPLSKIAVQTTTLNPNYENFELDTMADLPGAVFGSAWAASRDSTAWRREPLARLLVIWRRYELGNRSWLLTPIVHKSEFLESRRWASTGGG